MKIKEIEKDFYVYVFPPKEDNKFGYNIYVIIDKKEALVIDTGYKKHINKVLEDLKNKNIKITKVIISHFHLDNISGLTELKADDIIGSEDYEKTLDFFLDSDQHHLYKPNIKINQERKFKFGNFDLRISKFPGHAHCSILIFINEKFLHVGDELVYTNDGKDLLPYINKSTIKRHIKALENLKKYSNYIILPTHGEIVKRKDLILEDLNCRLKFLKELDLESKNLSYNEVIEECNKKFNN